MTDLGPVSITIGEITVRLGLGIGITQPGTGGGTPTPTPATWNPADKDARITLSNGNLTVTGDAAGWESVRATRARTSTGYYEKTHNASISGIGGPLQHLGMASR